MTPFQSLRDLGKDERGINPAVGRSDVAEYTFEPNRPRQNGASWPQLFLMVSYFAQIAPELRKPALT
jgi:hypothetical protein